MSVLHFSKKKNNKGIAMMSFNASFTAEWPSFSQSAAVDQAMVSPATIKSLLRLFVNCFLHFCYERFTTIFSTNFRKVYSAGLRTRRHPCVLA